MLHLKTEQYNFSSGSWILARSIYRSWAMNETYCINTLIFYHKLSLQSSGSSEDWLLDGEPGPKGQNTSDRQGSSPRTPTQGKQGRPKGGVRFNQEHWSSGKSMVMRQVRGQARQSGQDQVWWGSDTTQWLPGMHSDEATLRSRKTVPRSGSRSMGAMAGHKHGCEGLKTGTLPMSWRGNEGSGLSLNGFL